MGVFLDSKPKKFVGLKEQPTQLISTQNHPIWITSLKVCNRTAFPLRFNSRIATLSGTTLKKDCFAASTTDLGALYVNGISGEGATLTNNGTLTGFTIDGTFPVINSRILVKDQTNPLENGIYCLTTTGDALTAWVLTRSFDYDTPDEIQQGDVVKIVNGTLNGGAIWNQTSVVATVGVSPITFMSIITTFTQITNEYPIEPYVNEDIIDKVGVIELDYSVTPFVLDSFICNTNGYSQVFDCTVNYSVIKELPFR